MSTSRLVASCMPRCALLADRTHARRVDHSGRFFQDQSPTQVQGGSDTSCLEPTSRPSSPLLPITAALGIAFLLTLALNIYFGVAAWKRRGEAKRRRRSLIDTRIARIWKNADESTRAKYQQMDDTTSVTSESVTMAESENRPMIRIKTSDLTHEPTQKTAISNFVTSPASALLFRSSPFARGAASTHSGEERSDVANSDAATIAGSESLYHRSSTSSRQRPEPQFFPLAENPFQD